MENDFDLRVYFDGGYLYVKSDKVYCYPWNMVNGRMYVRVEEALDPDSIEIEVKG